MVHSDRTRGCRHKLEHRKFLMKVRKNFFDLKVIEHWNRLPERLWSLLEIFKIHLYNLLQ